MGKKAYFRMELARVLLFPLLLFIVTLLFIWFGVVSPDQVSIVWVVIAIETVAHLFSLIIIRLFED